VQENNAFIPRGRIEDQLTSLGSVDVTDEGRKAGRYYFFLGQRRGRAVR